MEAFWDIANCTVVEVGRRFRVTHALMIEIVLNL
jgi:hypothetical protein